MALGMVLIGVGTYMMIQKKDEKKVDKAEKGWFAYAAMSAVFASITVILGKIGIENVDSTLGTAICTLIVLIMAWILVFVQRDSSLTFSLLI